MPKRRRDSKSTAEMTCRAISDLLFDYASGRLGPRLALEFEEHLRICRDCVSFLRTYKKTVTVAGSLDPVAIPPIVRENVLSFLRRKGAGRLRVRRIRVAQNKV